MNISRFTHKPSFPQFPKKAHNFPLRKSVSTLDELIKSLRKKHLQLFVSSVYSHYRKYPHQALKCCEESFIKEVIDTIEDVSVLDENGDSLLSVAVQENLIAFIGQLTREKLIHYKNNQGLSPYEYALIKGNFHTALFFLDFPKQKNLLLRRASINCFLERGIKTFTKEHKYLLYWAIQSTHQNDIPNTLSKVSLDPLERHAITGESALHFAAVKCGKKVIQELLEGGFQINAKDTKGLTPLAIAIEKWNRPAALALLEKGADPNAYCSNRTPAIVEAANSSEWKIVQVLLKTKTFCLKEMSNKNKERLFELAIQERQKEVVEALYYHMDMPHKIIERNHPKNNRDYATWELDHFPFILQNEIETFKKSGTFILGGYFHYAFIEEVLHLQELIKCYLPNDFSSLMQRGAEFDIQLAWGIGRAKLSGQEKRIVGLTRHAGMQKVEKLLRAYKSDSELLNLAKRSLSSNIYSEINQGKEALLLSGWHGHTTSLFFTSISIKGSRTPLFIKCNRGKLEKDQNFTLELYSYKHTADESVLSDALKHTMTSVISDIKYFEKGINQRLGATYIAGINFKKQKIGSCAYAHAKILIYCKAFADALKKCPDLSIESLKMCHQSAYPQYKLFTAFTRWHTLYHSIDNLPNDFLMQIKEKALSKLNGIDMSKKMFYTAFSNSAKLQEDYIKQSLQLIEEKLNK